MDVAEAFNNIYYERLLDNMQKRRVPKQIIKWIGSFLQARTTQLRFNDFTSTPIATPAGTPQGSPLSPLLYMFYNGDLLDIPAPPHLSLASSSTDIQVNVTLFSSISWHKMCDLHACLVPITSPSLSFFELLKMQ